MLILYYIPEPLGLYKLGASRLLPFSPMIFVFNHFIITSMLFEVFLHCVLVMNLISAFFIIIIEHLFVCLFIIHNLHMYDQGQSDNSIYLTDNHQIS